MDRRIALRNLLLASGSLITLPSWVTAYGADYSLHLSSFTVSEQKILAKVVDTIIPAGNGIGALSVAVDKYLQRLIDDTFEDAEQSNVKSGLLNLNKAAKATYKKTFTLCTKQQREALLEKWAVSQDKIEKDWFEMMKRETIRGFSSSQQVLGGYHNYKVAPGYYYGCVNVTPGPKGGA